MTTPDEAPKPPVRRRCKRCLATLWGSFLWAGGRWGEVVSPTGLAHIGEDYGMTACGIDGTRDGWWWPL